MPYCHFLSTRQSATSHKDVQNILMRSSLSSVLFILSMGYKKDIFGSFAYEFELLHKR